MRVDNDFLDLMRQSGDIEADNVIAAVAHQKQEQLLYRYFGLSRVEIKGFHALPEVRDFLLAPAVFPEWYDEERLLRGQRFFRRYALDIMTLLGALSLPYCYAASPGNKAIYLTEKMRKTPGKRLLETAHFIIEVMKEGSFSANGHGAFEIQKTRLVHALVRHYILSRTSWRPEWGFPVNQEDMAGTNLAFSYIIVVGLEQSDFQLDEQGKNDFLYAWKFIGHQLRIDQELLPSAMDDAAALEKAIRDRHFRHSEEGRMLTRDLIRHYQEEFPPVASHLVDSQIRYFVGAEVSEYLGLPPNPIKDKIVSALNRVRRQINRVGVNPFSYQIMMRNHLKLTERYRDGKR